MSIVSRVVLGMVPIGGCFRYPNSRAVFKVVGFERDIVWYVGRYGRECGRYGTKVVVII